MYDLVRITSSYFVAGIEMYSDHHINTFTIRKKTNRCAPIIKYMRNWNIIHIKNYCKYKKWKCEVLNV